MLTKISVSDMPRNVKKISWMLKYQHIINDIDPFFSLNIAKNVNTCTWVFQFQLVIDLLFLNSIIEAYCLMRATNSLHCIMSVIQFKQNNYAKQAEIGSILSTDCFLIYVLQYCLAFVTNIIIVLKVM